MVSLFCFLLNVHLSHFLKYDLCSTLQTFHNSLFKSVSEAAKFHGKEKEVFAIDD